MKDFVLEAVTAICKRCSYTEKCIARAYYFIGGGYIGSVTLLAWQKSKKMMTALDIASALAWKEDGTIDERVTTRQLRQMSLGVSWDKPRTQR